MVVICGCTTGETAPGAVKGVLDLSGWDFEKNGAVELGGQWAFYPDRLLTPDDFDDGAATPRPLYVNLPNLWNSHAADGAVMPPRGVATYRLTVKIKPEASRLALMIGRPLSVARVWVNGRLLGETGTVGTDSQSESPRDHLLLRSFNHSGDALRIVVQVSNHHNMQGGLNDPVLLGSETMLQRATRQGDIVTAFFCGGLFIMAVIHLLLFMLRRAEVANLYFGLYCLLQSLGRMAGDMRVSPLEIVLPGLPWRAGIDLTIVSMTVSIPLLVMLYHALFPWKYGRAIQWFYGGAAALLMVYVALTPPNAYDPVVMIFVTVALTAFPYLFCRFILDLVGKRDGAGILAPGYLVLALVLVMDLFFEFHLSETVRLVPVAMFLFVLSYSFLISVRYARTFSHLETISSALEKNNRELGRQIRQKESALLREKREKLQKLRYQLNPHFLFNGLASIRGAISKDRDAARRMVSHLSEFCRLALSGGEMDLLTVAEEIETIRHYLALEQMRLGDYLNLSITTAPGTETMKLPAFLLHPLVENAVKYGSRTSPDTLAVAVRATLPSPDTLRVTVSNTGHWVAPEAVDEKRSTGTGLNNVRERLEQYYGGAFVFEIRKDDGRVRIQLDFPGILPEAPDGLRGRRGYRGGGPI